MLTWRAAQSGREPHELQMLSQAVEPVQQLPVDTDGLSCLLGPD